MRCAACGPRGYDLKQGAFTLALLEALDGKADGFGPEGKKDGEVRLEEIAAYLADHVAALTRGAQTPVWVPPKSVDTALLPPLALLR